LIDTPIGGELNVKNLGPLMASLLPEDTIISNESGTSGFIFASYIWDAKPCDWLSITGGSIGQGIPVATGAAVAAPDRPVVCLQGDGGAMYTIQALWTQAREGLNVTNIIFSNKSYAILQVELERVGALETGDRANSMLSMDNPEIDWVSLSKSLGVPAKRTVTVEEFRKAFSDGLVSEGPSLIEIVV
jgi:acetolactate synthase-1/2/3 large subunit